MTYSDPSILGARPVATEDRDQVNGAGAPEGAGPALGDAEEWEPYLPPGPNPFSSVHPQGAPPFERVPWSGSSVSEGAHDEEASAERAESSAEPESAAEPEDAEPATDPGLIPPAAAAEPSANGQSGGRPAVSPYPPLPDDELGHGGPGLGGSGLSGGSSRPGGFGASPYPTYTPYGPDDEIADDALTDYGLPSPQSYGDAPPPPTAEPLPDLGVPEPRFRPTPPSPSTAGRAAPAPPASPPAPPLPPPPPHPRRPHLPPQPPQPRGLARQPRLPRRPHQPRPP